MGGGRWHRVKYPSCAMISQPYPSRRWFVTSSHHATAPPSSPHSLAILSEPFTRRYCTQTALKHSLSGETEIVEKEMATLPVPPLPPPPPPALHLIYCDVVTPSGQIDLILLPSVASSPCNCSETALKPQIAFETRFILKNI